MCGVRCVEHHVEVYCRASEQQHCFEFVSAREETVNAFREELCHPWNISVSKSKMVLVCYILVAVFVSCLLSHTILEIHYFMRMLLVLIFSFFKKKSFILDECTMSGICLTTDIDLLLFHMNNARYVRELDFARFDFFKRTGLFLKIKSKGGTVVQGANTIRYRKFIRPFTKYQIKSKILYWDDQNIYMEHRFITPKDDFVRAIALGRQRVINCNANDVMQELISKDGKLSEETYLKPELPLEVAKWIESNEISSLNLRNGL